MKIIPHVEWSKQKYLHCHQKNIFIINFFLPFPFSRQLFLFIYFSFSLFFYIIFLKLSSPSTLISLDSFSLITFSLNFTSIPSPLNSFSFIYFSSKNFFSTCFVFLFLFISLITIKTKHVFSKYSSNIFFYLYNMLFLFFHYSLLIINFQISLHL